MTTECLNELNSEEYLGCCCVSDPCEVMGYFPPLETDSPTVSKPTKNTDCCGYWDYNPKEFKNK